MDPFTFLNFASEVLLVVESRILGKIEPPPPLLWDSRSLDLDIYMGTHGRFIDLIQGRKVNGFQIMFLCAPLMV
jgi:hypothetical protein